MHQSSKAFFEKDSVLMWSAVTAVVLWIINGALNLAAGSYTSFFINLFYVICLLTLCGAEFKGQKNVVQGMIGALMMVFAMGNVNVLSAALKNLTMDPQAPSRVTWQLAVSFFLALALFINHFLITSTNYRTSRRIVINQVLILAILVLRCYQIIINFVSGDFSQVMIRSTAGMLAIIPMLNAVICIECRGDAYIV